MGKDKSKEIEIKGAKISDKEGLKVSYDKGELNKSFPHLTTEIFSKKKSVRIDSVSMKIEEIKNDNSTNQINTVPGELINPGVIDFIRRCTTKKEALEILDYCLKKKEISLIDYENYKNQIMQEGGLSKLIEKSGGPKRHGYYERKYYKKNFKHQQLKSNDK